MNYTKVFKKINDELIEFEGMGSIATYIPELSSVKSTSFGVHLITTNNKHFCFGDSDQKFSIQSISKVLSLVLAYKLEDEDLWSRVGVEPSGTSFNSLIQLENDEGIPRNPLINAGALVICDVLVSHLENPKKDFIEFIRTDMSAEDIIVQPETPFDTKFDNLVAETQEKVEDAYYAYVDALAKVDKASAAKLEDVSYEILAKEGINVRVVSMPSMDIFKYQSKEYNKESLRNNEKHCGFDTLRLRRMEYV